MHICFRWMIKTLESTIPRKTHNVLSFSRKFKTVFNCYIEKVFEHQIIAFIWYCLTNYYCAPYKRVLSYTIALWIRKTMEEAGINYVVFLSHSCQSAATRIKPATSYLTWIINSVDKSSWFSRFFRKTVKINPREH